MSNIFYLDYENGSDANNGSTWGLAWRTITGGATAARIAPGDVIRIAKSPPPSSIGNATWTNLSRAVVLDASQNTTIELCETAWTAATNVTATTSTTRKEGANAASLAVAAAFATGKVAHRSFTSLNLSSFQRISFWIRTSAIITAGWLRVALCSDTAGDVVVDNFTIPLVTGTGRYMPFTLTRDGGGNLGSAIQSIAIYADADPGTPTILLDNFIACAANGLNLQSLISKNSAEQGGTEGWFGIKSIVGTAIQLDNDTNSSAIGGRGYFGVTENVATFRRETIKTDLAAFSGDIVQAVQDSGTLGNNIQFQGGWNTATTIQDGETFFDGRNGNGVGLHVSGRSFVTINLLCFFRYLDGSSFSNSHNNTIITLSNVNNNAADGLYFSNSHNNTIITLSNVNNNAADGLYFSSSYNNTITTLSNVNNNNSHGLYFLGSHNNIITTFSNANNNISDGLYFSSSYNNTITTISNVNNNNLNGVHFFNSHNNTLSTLSGVNNNASNGVYFDNSLNNIIFSAFMAGNISSGVRSFRGSRNYISNAILGGATPVSIDTPFAGSCIFSNRHGGNPDDHRIFTDGGLIASEMVTRHTPSGLAWRLSPTSANRSATYPLILSIAKVACFPNSQVTIKAWMRRSSTELTLRMFCRGGQIAGVSNDLVSSVTAGADIWQEQIIQFTPTERGVVEIEAMAWGGTIHSGFVDDMTISQV